MASWEPKWSNPVLTNDCINRIQRDTADLINSPPHGMLALPAKDHIQNIWVMMVGLKDTPYQGGMFYFTFHFPSDYPYGAPKAVLQTTGNGAVRFGPQLKNTGQVCHSILGTYGKSSWVPEFNMSGACVSIQSLLNKTPYLTEPGCENSQNMEIIERYDKIVLHETIRIAACEVYDRRKFYPEHFHKFIEDTFKENYSYYVNACKSNIHHDGKSLNEAFCGTMGTIRFKRLLEKLESYRFK